MKKDGKAGKFLTFLLAGEEYGIEILKVQEIIGMMPITRVPRTPRFVRGVINLRGQVIPVVDLRAKFGMETIAPTAETCIIVVRTRGVVMGTVVDKVLEVHDVAGPDLDEVPSFGAAVKTDYLLGVGKAPGKVKLLLDIDKVLSAQEVIELHDAAGNDPKVPEGVAEEVKG